MVTFQMQQPLNLNFEMKKIILLLTVLLMFQKVFPQNENEVCPLLQKAAKSYCDGNYKTSIKTLNEFLRLYPSHLLNQEAMYARGLCAYLSGKEKLAYRYLEEVMSLKSYQESDSFGYSILLCNYIQNNCKNILVPDYLQNLQHEASILLYELEMKNKNYAKAYVHLDNAARYYRFWYGCGTTDLEESMRLALLFSAYYDKINQPDTAVYELFPFLFEPSAFPGKYYENVCKTAADKLIKLKGEAEVKSELAKAVRDVYYESHEDLHGHEARIWYVRFFGFKIKASPEYLHSKVNSPDEVRQYLMQTTFYKLIFNLP